MELELLSVKCGALALLLIACAPAGPAGVTASPGASPSPSPSTSTSTSTSTTESAPSTSTEGEPPTLPGGTTILHIGDSMAGALGMALNEELRRVGVKSVLHFKNASYTPTWAWSQELPVLLARHKPDLVLITLGTNELAIKRPERRAPAVQKLVGRLEGRPCVWIAPPLWAKENGMLSVIRENAAPCRYMDTNAIVPAMPRLRDKIHPTMKARQDWAKVVVDWLARERDPNGETPWQLKSE